MAAGSTRGIKAGRAYVELGTADKYSGGLKRASRRLKAFGAGVRQVGASMIGVGAAIIGPLIAASKHFASYGDQVAKMSKRTGVSVEALSELQFVASQTGTEFATLENAFRKMQRSIFDAGRGLSTQTEALEALGLSYEDLAGKAPEKQFKILSARLGDVADDTKQAAIAQMLFGRTGTNLIPMFEAGAEGIEKLQQQARKLGLTMSREDAKAAEEFADELDATWKVVKMGAFAVGRELAPALIELVQWIRGAAKEATAWVRENRELITSALKLGAILAGVGVVLVVVGAAIGVFAKTIAILVAVIKVSIIVVKALGVAFTFLAAHPVVAALVAVVAVVVGVTLAIKALSGGTAELSTRMQELAAAGEKQRDGDEKRLKRLDQLNKKQKLTSAEMAEARSLISQLTASYGDLGIGIDAATGKLTGFAKAQSRVSRLMREAAKTELGGVIKELEANLRKVKQAGPDRGWFNGYLTFSSTLKKGRNEFYKQTQSLGARIKAAKLRLEALSAVEGKAGAPGNIGARIAADDKVTEANRRNIRDLAAIKLRAIADEEKREAALLRHRYLESVRTAKTIGADETTVAKQYAEELRQLRKKFADRRAEEAKKLADDRAAAGKAAEQAAGEDVLDEIFATGQQRVAMEKATQDELARLKIEREKTGLAKTLAILALEEAAEIKAAEAVGAQTDQIREKFRLRGELAKRAADVRLKAKAARTAKDKTADRFSTVGSFDAFRVLALQGAGTAQERAAAAAELTAKNTGELVRSSRKGRLVFTN